MCAEKDLEWAIATRISVGAALVAARNRVAGMGLQKFCKTTPCSPAGAASRKFRGTTTLQPRSERGSQKNLQKNPNKRGQQPLDTPRLVPGDPGGELLRRLGRGIAAPGHVQVGPQQDQVRAVDIARGRVRHVEDRERRADLTERAGERP